MNPREKVYDIVRSFSSTMMVTAGPGKQLESRPMQIAKVEEDADLWFFTAANGRLVEDIGADPSVLLVFQDELSAYLSLRCKARIVQDKARMMELWQEAYKVWFPGGLDDPDLALVGVRPVNAEYWDNRGMNKLEYMFEAAKAYVKGEQPDVEDIDKHAKVKM